MSRFTPLLNALARALPSDERTRNQFAHDDPRNKVRRRNLSLYLTEVAALNPSILLVGEAVSHRGGRITGIPFVSEAIMIRGVETVGGIRVLGAENGYRRADPLAPVSTEASATMVWGTIATIAPLPLLWNAFPWHPHRPGEPKSNRAPLRWELELGAPILERLLAEFDLRQIVAIGNHASTTLTMVGVEHVKVRHPSQGGKNLFVEGMARVSQRRSR